MSQFLLLFDIDGTLLLTAGAGTRAMASAGQELFGSHFSLDGFDAAGKLDPVIFNELAVLHGINDADLYREAFRDAYLVYLQQELDRTADRVCLMPGIRRTLSELRSRNQASGDIQMGLLSGNYRAAVPIKFSAVGIDLAWFEISALGEDAPTRSDLTQFAMLRYADRWGRKPDPKRVIVIGDTPRDVTCAKAHGCVSFAVATGRYSTGDLEFAGADIVVKDMGDSSVLFDLID